MSFLAFQYFLFAYAKTVRACCSARGVRQELGAIIRQRKQWLHQKGVGMQDGKSVSGSGSGLGPLVRIRDSPAVTQPSCSTEADLRPRQGSQARVSTGEVQDRAQAQLLHSCNGGGQWYSHSLTALPKEEGAGPHFYLFSQLLFPAEDLALDSASWTLT